MTQVNVGYVNNLQDDRRLPGGTRLGGYYDELLWVLPVVKIGKLGEQVTVAHNTGDLLNLANFIVVGDPPTSLLAPSNSPVSYDLARMEVLTEIQPTLQIPNSQPNDIMEDDRNQRRAGMLRMIAQQIGRGHAGGDADGFSGMLEIATEEVLFQGVGAGQVTDTLRLMFRKCMVGKLGTGPTAFVTSQRGRDNIERAFELQGIELESRRFRNLPEPVPHWRGRPILASDGFQDGNPEEGKVRICAYCESDCFLVGTTGTPETVLVEQMPVPMTTGARYGYVQIFHGALVRGHQNGVVKGTITESFVGV